MEKIKIIVDDREMRSKIVRELYDLGSIITSKRLEIGDYICSNRTCIERKTSKDFVASIIDRRLFQQAKDLTEQFKRPLMIIECFDGIFSYRNVHPNAIRGALSTLAIKFGISIIPTDGPEETARMIYSIAKTEQMENGKEVALRGSSSGLTEKQQQEFLVEGLPLVGPKMAKNLLEHFGTVGNVFRASEEELKKIKNMGHKKSSAIRYIITKKYEGNKNDKSLEKN